MFIMAWGLRRIAFTVGAVLLIGGWGLTKFVDAHQRAAGAEARAWWRDGVPQSQGTTAPPMLMTPAGGDAVPVTHHAAPPSSWLFLLSVAGMAIGGGLMALTVPWRGERLTVATPAHAPGSQGQVRTPTLVASHAPQTQAQAGSPAGESGAPKPIRFKRGA